MSILTAEIIATDPWEIDPGPYLGTISSKNRTDNFLLIKLDYPMTVNNKIYPYLASTPREQGDKFQINKQISCNCTGILNNHLADAEKFDLSWWRGGLAFIGDMIVKDR